MAIFNGPNGGLPNMLGRIKIRFACGQADDVPALRPQIQRQTGNGDCR